MTDLNHLQWLLHDPIAFEKERRRLIDEHITEVPPEHRDNVIAFQARIDDARNRMSRDKFLAWMANELAKLSANLDEQLERVKQLRDRS